MSIDPKAIDPDDVSLLEDLVLAALRDAAEQLQAGQSGAMGGLDLGGLGGLLGASELLLDGSGTHRSTRTASGHRPEVCSARGVSSPEGTEEDALRLSRAIVDAKERVSFCSRCFNLSEGGDECAICLDPRRETRMVCVVEDSQDIVAIERTQEFRGRYHVLQGAFSPIDGVGVEQLRVKELMSRVADEDIEEIIVATNPNLEGEATAALLVKYLKPMGVRVSRIARVSRSAAISSTPTSSPSAGLLKVARCSTPATTRSPEVQRSTRRGIVRCVSRKRARRHLVPAGARAVRKNPAGPGRRLDHTDMGRVGSCASVCVAVTLRD